MKERVYYLNDDGEIVPESMSTFTVIQKIDEEGHVIKEIKGMTGDQLSRRPQPPLPTLTPEQAEFLESFKQQHSEAMAKFK